MGPAGGVADPIVTNLVAEDKVPWYRKPNLRVLYMSLFFCCMSVEMTAGFDGQLIQILQFSGPFNSYFGGGYLNDQHKYAIEPSLLGFISASYQLGSVLAVPVAPWINQRYGRRWSIRLGSLFMIAGALLQSSAQHVAMLIIARMLLGFGIVFAIIGGAALTGELGHPKERATLTSLFKASYAFGAIAAASIGLGTVEIKDDWSWRVPSLLQMFPSMFQVIFLFLLPESPRYLVSKDRDDDAHAILVKYHAEGDRDSVLVRAEMSQIKSTIKLEMENSEQSWMDMISTAGMRRRVLIASFLGLFTQWSGITLLSYYSNLLFDLMGFNTPYIKTRINVGHQCMGLVTGVPLALIVPRFRRRTMFLTSVIWMLLIFIAMTVSFEKLREAKDHNTTNPAAQIAALVFFLLYGPGYSIGNSALTYTYLIELFPYAQRSRGIGLEQLWGKLGGFVSTYVNPIAMAKIGWKFMAVICGWLAFEFVFIYIFYPETHGRTLEELAFLFEDKALADRAALEVVKEIDTARPAHHVETSGQHGKGSAIEELGV